MGLLALSLLLLLLLNDFIGCWPKHFMCFNGSLQQPSGANDIITLILQMWKKKWGTINFRNLLKMLISTQGGIHTQEFWLQDCTHNTYAPLHPTSKCRRYTDGVTGSVPGTNPGSMPTLLEDGPVAVMDVISTIL